MGAGHVWSHPLLRGDDGGDDTRMYFLFIVSIYLYAERFAGFRVYILACFILSPKSLLGEFYTKPNVFWDALCAENPTSILVSYSGLEPYAQSDWFLVYLADVRGLEVPDFFFGSGVDRLVVPWRNVQWIKSSSAAGRTYTQR